MYTVSETARRVGVARSTLLYYERIGLVTPERDPANGYRRYGEAQVARLIALRQLQRAGLTLQECRRCLAGELPAELVRRRLDALEGELRELLLARELLRSFAGEKGDEGTRAWHDDFVRRSPEAHHQWLRGLGFSELEAMQIRWVSKDMNENDEYMALFYEVFEGMERQGPGDEGAALRLLRGIPEGEPLARAVDMGCGTGAGALFLAERTDAAVTAIDNYRPFLDRLDAEAAEKGCGERITSREASMSEPPFEAGSLDLIWSEGSAYLMGFENALKSWCPLLREGGFLVVSEMCWFTDDRSPEAERFWSGHYPDIRTADERTAQAKALGYQVLDAFPLPQAAWGRFFADMGERIAELRAKRGDHRVYRDCEEEMELFARFGEEFGYHCLLLRKVG